MLWSFDRTIDNVYDRDLAGMSLVNKIDKASVPRWSRFQAHTDLYSDNHII